MRLKQKVKYEPIAYEAGVLFFGVIFWIIGAVQYHVGEEFHGMFYVSLLCLFVAKIIEVKSRMHFRLEGKFRAITKD